MEGAIYVIPRSTTTNQNVFEITYTQYDAHTFNAKKYCYFRHVHDGEDIWLWLKTYLRRNLIEVNLAHYVVCMELDWLKEFLDRVIDNDDAWHKRINTAIGKTDMIVKDLNKILSPSPYKP